MYCKMHYNKGMNKLDTKTRALIIRLREERSRLSIRGALPHGMPRPATTDRRTGNQRA
jgi:hypothetical protein